MRYQYPEKRFGYFIIPIFVMGLYVSTIASYLKYGKNILPSGDPFTYTLGFFRILDVSRHGFFDALAFAFQSNFYWLINLIIAIFSPMLTKEPLSIAMVNFFMWGIASISFYRLGVYLRLGFGLSLISALIIWIYPVNYGFLDHSSITVLALDAMFLGILHVALANVIIYSIDTRRLVNALIASLSVGLAIWGRGNSPPVVLMVIFIPALLILYNIFINRKDSKTLLNFALFSAIIFSMGFVYYYFKYAPIALYYKAQAAFVERHIWNLKDALPFILNVPGFFFYRVENSFATIMTSLLLHILVIISLFINARKIVAITGVFIYFATYIINIILFTDPLITLQNCLLIYAPMRIGISLCLISIIAKIVETKKIIIPSLVLYASMGFLIFYGSTLTRKLMPEIVKGRPTPKDVESFSIKLDEMVKDGAISILWYDNYNPVIINYYRRKNDLPEIPQYSSLYYNDIWAPYGYTEDKRRKVKEEIKSHFEGADLIIIPENMESYLGGHPYPLYRFKDEISNYINSKNSPKFVVRMVVKEDGDRRLLVLQRAAESHGIGELLKLPFGLPGTSRQNYGATVIKHPS